MSFKKSFLALLAAGTAALATPAMAQNAAGHPDADPALWVVEDADTTIYLFGTVHILPQNVVWFDEAVRDAFNSSESLVLEVSPEEMANAQGPTMRLGMLPEGQSLRGMMNAEDRAAYEAALTKLGVPQEQFAAFDRFKPWFAATFMGMLPILKAGYQPGSGAEMTLSPLAASQGKVTQGLETIEQQLGFFDGLPAETQMRYLRTTADNVDKTVPMIDAMVGKWATGDTDGLAVMMNEGFSEQIMYDVLLTNRNANWADWIKTRLDQPGNVFIAVGAGHLAGGNSVQAKLAERGVGSERIHY